MAENWGDIFTGLQSIDAVQQKEEKETDIGEDNEVYVERMLSKDDRVTIAGVANRLPSRITHHPWLLQVRNTAIESTVRVGGPLRVKKITVYTAVILVDRFLSSMPIVSEKFERAELLAMACLYLASVQMERYDHHPALSEYERFSTYTGGNILSMRSSVVVQLTKKGLVSVTPIHFIKYFVSIFCKDVERKEYARVKAVELIMSILGDFRLMSLRAFTVGAAATLLASNPNILTEQMIQDELNALPQNWIIPLDEVYSCYNRLLETNRHRLDIN